MVREDEITGELDMATVDFNDGTSFSFHIGPKALKDDAQIILREEFLMIFAVQR